MSDARLEAACAARERYFHTLGNPDDDVWSHLINPAFMGGPQWPSLRQGWRRIQRDASTIIISDGLSDPFEDESDPNVGFGIEILVETPDAVAEDLRDSWLFHLVYQVTQNAAAHGGYRQIVEELNIFTLEIAAIDALNNFANAEGRVGVLLGLNPPDLAVEVELPGGTLRPISAKLLTLTELNYVINHRQAGRLELKAKFEEDRSYHLSSLSRASVV